MTLRVKKSSDPHWYRMPQSQEGITGLGQAVSGKNERPTEACFVLLSRKTTGHPHLKPETLGSLVIQAKGTNINPSLIFLALSDEGQQLGAVSKGIVYQTLFARFQRLSNNRKAKEFCTNRNALLLHQVSVFKNWILKYYSARLKKPQMA